MACIFQMLILTFSMASITLGQQLSGGTPYIGACYGTHADNLPSPKEVVNMYLSNKIQRMRLYEPSPRVFEALRGSGIQVSVGVKEEDIELLAYSYSAANMWVEMYIRSYWPDVHFRYIVVGNEVVTPSGGFYAHLVISAMRHLHNALSIDGLWHRIKVTTAVSPSVLGVSFPPSAGEFSESVIEYIAPIAQCLDSIGAPLLANIYPYFTYLEHPNMTLLPYALFTRKSNFFMDYGLGYWNSFDATVDAFHAALEKVGVPRVPVVVSETGWPSSGNNFAANILFAWLYNSNLVEHVLSSLGTPRWPGAPVETYLFAVFNEDGRKLGGTGDYNFGLFYPDKRPVYPIKFA